MGKLLFAFVVIPLLCAGQTTTNYGTNLQFSNIKFINDKEGWVVGGSVQKKLLIFKTVDGGNSWKDISLRDSILMKIEEVEFLDSKTGFIAGGPGFIFKTSDGGVTWKRVYRSNDNKISSGWFLGITVVNEKLAFAYGRYGVFLISTDGGETWRRMKLNEKDRAYGELITKATPYLISTESGLSRVRYFPKNDSLAMDDFYSSNYETPALQLLDSKNGWAAGQGALILKIENGIATPMVDPKDYDYNYMSSLYFHNMNEGWVCTNREELLYTKDKGRTWKTIKGFPSGGLNKIIFTSKTNGFTCGLDVVYRTNDKGKSWQLVLCEAGMKGYFPSVITDQGK